MTNSKCVIAIFVSIALACALQHRLHAEPAENNTPTEPTVSKAVKDDSGFLIHRVQSLFQSGTTEIKVLLPDRIEKDTLYRVLYVLPVEAKNESRYGNGLKEVLKHNLHNKHHLICITPTFSHLPWYANHPDKPAIQQETYFLKVVLPFVEKTYPVRAGREGRLLVGFSKSGWGSWTLLLRHPDLFDRAAAWDVPLAMQEPGKYGTKGIYATQENFEKYRIFDLLKEHSKKPQTKKRLVLTGHGDFRQHHFAAHVLMDALEIPHVYRDGPRRKHIWGSGWLPETVDLLAAESNTSTSPIFD